MNFFFGVFDLNIKNAGKILPAEKNLNDLNGTVFFLFDDF
jgi:hypothetical protein